MTKIPDTASGAQALTGHPARALKGVVTVPGDKSISHRALMIGALTAGETLVSGLLEGEDVLSTAACLRAMGADIERLEEGRWRVRGLGVSGLCAPSDILDFGNSGTSIRLMMGILAGQPGRAILTGDESLRRRPMGRVADPLRQMGAEIELAAAGGLPLTMRGGDPLRPVVYRVPVPSAQVKSAVLLAGLHAPGETSVIEAVPTRDHTERMLTRAGASLRFEDSDEGRVITIVGEPELTAADIEVPADPSSAAFPLVAALIVPDSEVVLTGVMMNPHRTGLIATLKDMGGDIAVSNERDRAGEPVADVTVRTSQLRAIEVPPERAPSMIDEYPVLAVAAAFAEGETVMNGLAELRVKECDRLAATVAGLSTCGVGVEERADGMTVTGRGLGGVEGGGTVLTHMDHRIAMAFLVLGLGARKPVSVDDGRMIATSFPEFTDLMTSLGARIDRSMA